MKAPIGFTLVFHLAIIAMSALRMRSSKKRRVYVSHLQRRSTRTNSVLIVASTLIQIGIFASLLSLGVYGVSYAIDDADSTITLLKHQHYGSRIYQPTPIEAGENHVIIRVDDVQPHTWSDISMRMIEDAVERDLKLSLGIIPHRLRSDQELVLFLKKHRTHLDFTLHGWGKGDPDYEFAQLSREEAAFRIDRALHEFRALTKHAPSTFIPPNNVYSEGTREALIESGFSIISSKGSETYDYTAKTYDFEMNVSIDNDAIIEDCLRGFEAKRLCVIMIHPQDFADGSTIDEERYAQYLDLLDRIDKLDARSATFEDYARSFDDRGSIEPTTPLSETFGSG